MKKIGSILLACMMVLSVILNTGVGVDAAILPGSPSMRCVPDQDMYDVKTGSQEVEYTIYLAPPKDDRIIAAQFTLTAPEGMTLLEDGFQINEEELQYVKTYKENGLFSNLSYTASTGVFLADAGLSYPKQFMEKEYWVLKVKASIDDMSKAGSYALQISNCASTPDLKGEDSFDSANYVITSTPVVVSVPIVDVTGIEVNPSSKVLAQPGEMFTLGANVVPSNATDQVVTYRSSNPEVATVDENGVVTGVSQGSAGIIVTSNDGAFTATCEVTVNQPLVSISVDKSTLAVIKGSDATLSVSYNPTNTTDDKRVTWSTSEAKVATVDANGKVTGVEEGEATITATVGTHTASCVVTVEKIELTDAMISEIDSVEYTGAELTPKCVVKDGNKTLVEGTDYTVSYKNNVNCGNATATVVGKGNYKGSVEKTFEIVANKLTTDMVSDITSVTYTGAEIIPNVVVKDGEKTLVKGTDYIVTCENNINVGEASAKIVGKGNYSGEVPRKFVIEAKTISDTEIDAITAYTYENKAHEPLPVVVDGVKTLVKDVDYRVSYEDNTNAGTAKVVITGIGNYDETNSATFTINKAEAPVLTFPTANDITYGNKLSAATFNGTSEYGTFAWKSEDTVPNAGEVSYAVVFTANEDTKKNYKTIEVTEQQVKLMVEKAEVAINLDAKVSGKIGAQTVVLSVTTEAVGLGAKPTGTVVMKNGTTELTTIELDAGEASYSWEVTTADVYDIVAEYRGNTNYKEAQDELQVDTRKKAQVVELQSVGDKTYGDEVFELVLENVLGTGDIKFSSSNESVLSIEGNKVTIIGAGNAVITATVGEDEVYQSATAELDVIVDKCEVTFVADDQTVRRGQPVEEYTYTVTGLVGADTVITEPTLTPSTTDTKTSGIYDISITDAEVSNSNSYSVQYENAKLVVEKGYNVVFNTDGGTVIETIEDVLYGDTVVAPANPTKVSHTFVGWYTSSEYKDEFDYATQIKADTEIVAKWSLNPITMPEELKITGNAIEILNPVISEEDLLNVFTEEELRSLVPLLIELNIDNIDMLDLDSEIQENLTKAVKEFKLTLGSVYDITMFKTVGDSKPVKVTKIEDEIVITMEIPKELLKEGRTFCLLREHDGVVTLLQDADKNATTLSCATDQFSTYAIAYTDEKLVVNDGTKTGDNTNVFVYIALLMIASVALIVVLKKRRLQR